MRPIAVALALCALPPAALARNGLCEACGHVASYFRGEGGFIGTVADGAGEVVFVASCGSVSVTGEVPVDGGTAALPFNRANGLACDRDGGALEIAGLKDGGWFWITDDVNSAVGSLVRKDVLENETVDITSAGEGVEMAMGTGAVYLRETATGRVGILPNILPEAPEALAKCGYNTGGAASAPTYSRRMTECELGDGGHVILATTTNGFTGATQIVRDKGMVTRPAGTPSSILVDLWGDMSGFFTTAGDDGNADTFADDPRLGNPAAAGTAARGNLRMGHGTAGAVTYAVTVGSGPGGGTTIDGANPTVAGVSLPTVTEGNAAGNAANAVVVSVAADSAYCSRTNDYPAEVTVTATITAAAAGEITPPMKRAAAPNEGRVGSLSFTVICQSGAASANPGVELVPENPFPVE